MTTRGCERLREATNKLSQRVIQVRVVLSPFCLRCNIIVVHCILFFVYPSLLFSLLCPVDNDRGPNTLTACRTVTETQSGDRSCARCLCSHSL